MAKKIKGGYILLARNIIESEIWQKPPAYLKIWIYILNRVNWRPSKKNEIGEDLFNFSQEKIPGITKFQVYEFLRWAKTLSPTDSTTQITTHKTTRGIRLKVTKYAYYQDPRNYKLQNTFQQTLQQIPNTIPETLNNNKEYIYNTHNIKNVCVKNKNFSDEDLKVLKKYAKKNGAKNIGGYVQTLIENGGYVDILKEEKERLEKLQRKKQEETIPPAQNFEKIDPADNDAGFEIFKKKVKMKKGEN